SPVRAVTTSPTPTIPGARSPPSLSHPQANATRTADTPPHKPMPAPHPTGLPAKAPSSPATTPPAASPAHTAAPEGISAHHARWPAPPTPHHREATENP